VTGARVAPADRYPVPPGLRPVLTIQVAREERDALRRYATAQGRIPLEWAVNTAVRAWLDAGAPPGDGRAGPCTLPVDLAPLDRVQVERVITAGVGVASPRALGEALRRAVRYWTAPQTY
jgi:hypothetical protein